MLLINPSLDSVHLVDRKGKVEVALTIFDQPIDLRNGETIVGIYPTPGQELNSNFYDDEANVAGLLERCLNEPYSLDCVTGSHFDERFHNVVKVMGFTATACVLVRTDKGKIAYCDFESKHNYFDIVEITEAEIISGDTRLTYTQAEERHQQRCAMQLKDLQQLFNPAAREAGADHSIFQPI